MHEADDKNIINLATELVSKCHLPELEVDIDTRPFERADFQTFNEILNANLNHLFDLIQTQKTVLFMQSTDTIEFQTKLILLICEQMNETDFQSDQILLRQNIFSLQKQYFFKLLSNNDLIKEVLVMYKSKIKINIWKQNIGAVHGFAKFCQVFTYNYILCVDQL